MTEYVKSSGYGTGWRAVQWLLTGMGALAAFLLGVLLPETSHARGIDTIRAERAAEREQSGRAKIWRDDWIIIWLNPLAPLKLLARPHILLVSLTSSFVLMSTYSKLLQSNKRVLC